eukprot:m.333879 g.333879  ORF g.333879 m.333879 type:complete len:431 (+) comp17239_c0_seq1:44-1336(+)
MKAYHVFLAVTMMVTGSINTITTKFADISCAPGLKDFNKTNATWHAPAPDNPCRHSYVINNKTGERDYTGGYHQFDHPFVQAFAMFVGEFLCLLAFKLIYFTNKSQGREMDVGPQTFNPIVWALPALCDSCATSAMYYGLTLTYASSFQMLRGAVVIFTGIMSILILGRKLKPYHWCGMFVVLLGLVAVGGAGFLQQKDEGAGSNAMPHQSLGDLIIIFAQVIVAFQMVVEEKLMSKYKTPPLQAVGWEGFFGMAYMAIFCTIFYHVQGPRADNTFENAYDAIAQIRRSVTEVDGRIALAMGGTVCSIALFNYSGLSVTKEMSATTRMVLDSLRTIIIWVFGLVAVDDHGLTKSHWETFDPKGPGYLQLAGFVFLLGGSALYNERENEIGIKEPLIFPLFRAMGISSAIMTASEEVKPLLQSSSINKPDI